ncbi:hypothetical protein M752DRAFT_154994 [Aspergillus phoenicis ATCC 13157]|uniref:Uncharacterized protein n=1 Tax=Aspergillus phoenicis ATCC 13157 TaxID=1353007 RepID=A0A370PMY8_ASPPH|nr:hypothetical protein M752DRAFT_154994 [Aspergillus phoenicis ATCC 13157]
MHLSSLAIEESCLNFLQGQCSHKPHRLRESVPGTNPSCQTPRASLSYLPIILTTDCSCRHPLVPRDVAVNVSNSSLLPYTW